MASDAQAAWQPPVASDTWQRRAQVSAPEAGRNDVTQRARSRPPGGRGRKSGNGCPGPRGRGVGGPASCPLPSGCAPPFPPHGPLRSSGVPDGSGIPAPGVPARGGRTAGRQGRSRWAERESAFFVVASREWFARGAQPVPVYSFAEIKVFPSLLLLWSA